MVHFWFGFFTAAMVNLIHKVYIRIIWNILWKNGLLQRNLDINEFEFICYFYPSLAISLCVTWIVSWNSFGNDLGFWIFWIYVLLLSVNGIRLYDYFNSEGFQH